jgi:mitochondrial fission protein ELM1
MHGVTREALDAAALRFRDRLAPLKRPLVAVLLGGPNGRYRMDREAVSRLASGLRRVAEDSGAGLAVTPSRRTGADTVAAIRAALAGTASEIWDETGDNPYLGYLALADAIVVTCDSVNMVSEACATGKPVHVFHLPGGSAKFRRFHASFEAAGFTRPFTGRLDSWSYDPPHETERVAALIRARLKDRAQAN